MEQRMNPNYIEFHPIGSVVIAKGNVKKMAIIARGIMAEINGTLKYFDYAAVMYPEGLLSEQLIYFNHQDILKVVHTGYSDDDEEMMRDTINEWMDKTDVKRGNPYELNLSNQLRKNKEERK